MFARKLAVVVVLLVAAPAFGDFSSELSMTGTDDGAVLLSGGTVEQGSLLTLLVTDAQTWRYPTPDTGGTGGRNHMTWVQLNFDASTPELLTTLLAPATTWAWDVMIAGTMFAEIDDSLNLPLLGDPATTPDYMVKRTGAGTWPMYMMDGPVHDLGTLTLTAPDYNPGGDNTYTVALDGGEYVSGTGGVATITQLIGIVPGEERAGEPWGTMTLNDFTFTVTPEPATLTLLALGGAAVFIRRKR